MNVDLLALVGASAVVAAAAVTAALAPAVWRTFRMTPSPAPTGAVPLRARGRVLVLPDEDLELCDFYDCPREQRRQPHAVSLDGSRRCWSCGHTTTPGETR